MESNEQDRKYIHEAFEHTMLRMLTDLFYNTCTCLRDNPKKEKLLNPKFHVKKCLYRKHVEEVGVEFTDE